MGRPRKNKEEAKPGIAGIPTVPDLGLATATMDKPDTEATESTVKVDKPEEVVAPKGMETVELGEYRAVVSSDPNAMIDPFYLPGKDPKYEYRFLYMEKKNLSMKTGTELGDRGGWQVCPREHLKRIGISSDMLNDKGQYQKGDTILSFMPKELFKKKEEYKRKKANAPQDAVQRLIKRGDPREGGQEIHDSMKGIQTDKALNM